MFFIFYIRIHIAPQYEIQNHSNVQRTYLYFSLVFSSNLLISQKKTNYSKSNCFYVSQKHNHRLSNCIVFAYILLYFIYSINTDIVRFYCTKCSTVFLSNFVSFFSVNTAKWVSFLGKLPKNKIHPSVTIALDAKKT